MLIDKINIMGVKVAGVNYKQVIEFIKESISTNEKKIIGYVNVNSINKYYKSKLLISNINSFDLNHADGIGIFTASRFLFGRKGLAQRFTGSDLYIRIIDFGIKNGWKFYFFGDHIKVLKNISVIYPELKICGLHCGYNFNTKEVLGSINKAETDLLVVGLGCPEQEEWIFRNNEEIKAKVIISVGGGIKIFAGKKIRGPKLFQILGMEWLIRLLAEPSRLWKRYLLGIPLFIFRIIKTKIINM